MPASRQWPTGPLKMSDENYGRYKEEMQACKRPFDLVKEVRKLSPEKVIVDVKYK